jgi:hypothetical protein
MKMVDINKREEGKKDLCKFLFTQIKKTRSRVHWTGLRSPMVEVQDTTRVKERHREVTGEPQNK